MYTPFSYWSTTCVDCVEQDIVIDTQTWMKCNLSVSTYRDGTPIPQVTDTAEWANTTSGSWCYVNNDPATEATYGKLYNGYAALGIHDAASLTDPGQRKILAPIGFHVPAVEEFRTLTGSLGGTSVAGGPLKQRGLCTWESPNEGATNSTGFTALGAGFRTEDGTIFQSVGALTYFWSTDINTSNTRSRTLQLSKNHTSASVINNGMNNGFSVRCLKD